MIFEDMRHPIGSTCHFRERLRVNDEWLQTRIFPVFCIEVVCARQVKNEQKADNR
jgi:hypothetical protein